MVHPKISSVPLIDFKIISATQFISFKSYLINVTKSTSHSGKGTCNIISHFKCTNGVNQFKRF